MCRNMKTAEMSKMKSFEKSNLSSKYVTLDKRITRTQKHDPKLG